MGKRKWYKRLGAWIDKEAVPFVKAGAKGMAAGGPYMGIASALTATNKRGGNPLGKVGKEAEKLVKPVVMVTESINVVNKLAEKVVETAAEEAVKNIPEVVLC